MKSAVGLHYPCVINPQEFVKSCNLGNTLRLALGFFFDDKIIYRRILSGLYNLKAVHNLIPNFRRVEEPRFEILRLVPINLPDS